MLNKKDLIRAVADATEKTQKNVTEVLDAMQDIVFAEMAKCEEVKIFDSISFSAKEVPERTAKNPQTGEDIVVPKHLSPKVKFGKTIKDYLNE